MNYKENFKIKAGNSLMQRTLFFWLWCTQVT